MPKQVPTLANLREYPVASVLLAWKKSEPQPQPDKVVSRDYEWFHDGEAMRQWVDENLTPWCETDVGQHGDYWYTLVELPDTSDDPLKPLRVKSFGGNQAWQNGVEKAIKNDPMAFLVHTAERKVRRPKKEQERKPPEAPVVKAKPKRQAATAASETAPKPAGPKVGRRPRKGAA